MSRETEWKNCSEHLGRKPEQQSDVIERMCDAFFNSMKPDPRLDDAAINHSAMTAAAKVCTDARDAQWENAIRDEFDRLSQNPWAFVEPHINTIIAHLRARLLPESKPDGYVIGRLPGAGVGVFDGDTQLGPTFLTHEDAKIFIAGLAAVDKAGRRLRAVLESLAGKE